MKVKINEKWFEGRYNDEKKFIIPLSEEQDVIFFYKWQKNMYGMSKSDYTKDLEYKTICESGTLNNCYPLLNINEDAVLLNFDSYKTNIDKEDLPKGISYVPYVIETTSTSINGTTVWYKNKWENLLLKIKFFFKKPNELKRWEIYSKKPINSKYYQKTKITK
jgi:hypothetical protein